MTTLERAQQIGMDVLKIAQENLQRDGHLVPTIFPVMNGVMLTAVVVAVGSQAEGRAALAAMAKVFALTKIDAVVMINDAYIKKADSADSMSNYRHGDLAKDPTSIECVIVSIKGPTVGSYTRTVPYHRDGKLIVFDEPMPWCDAVNNMLPDWWKSHEA